MVSANMVLANFPLWQYGELGFDMPPYVDSSTVQTVTEVALSKCRIHSGPVF